jgi:hypothetical protein
MEHDPNNPKCHHPPRKCICGITSVMPEDSPVAPALLAWVDTAGINNNISVKTAWLSAAVHFQREGVGDLFPDSTAEFVDILDYAAPLFDAERGVVFDTSHAESDGIIDVSRGQEFEPPDGLTL